jgi:hypothetical protein
MKKIWLSFLFILFTVAGGFCSTTWTLQGNSYTVDTLYHAYIGPGTTQTSLKLTGTQNLRVFYTTTDLTNQYVDVRAIMAGDKVSSTSTVANMAKSHSTSSRTYFAGVNADFFGPDPCGATVVDNEVFNTTNSSSWQQFGMDANRVPQFFNSKDFTCTLSGSFGNKAILVNVGRGSNKLVLYTNRFGSSTGTNTYGSEIVVVPQGAWGDTLKLKVSGSPVASVGDMTIPSGSYVLSGNGTMATFINGLTDGQELTFTSSVSGLTGKITQTLGGRPFIVSGGKVLDTESALDHLVSLNPRTAVGFDASKTKLVMLVVDGRSTISVGVVSKVLADIMINVGCTEAMNFDGGGSSTLYVNGFGVLNQVSDGAERGVTDGLFLATDAPADNVIAAIRFNDVSKRLPKYGYYKPVFYGYNKYGVLISSDLKGVKLSCDAGLGAVQGDGETLFCNGSGTYALTATYNGVSTTIPVTIVGGVPAFRLANAIDDGYRGYQVEVQTTVGEEQMPIDNQALTWSSDDQSIATIDANGIVKGVKDGTTIIRGKVDTFEGVLNVTVEKPTAHIQAVEKSLDPSTWTITQSGGSGIQATAHDNGMTLTYTGASSRAPFIKLAKPITLWSIPDTIRIRINPGNANIKTLTFSTVANGTTVNTAKTLSLTANAENIIDLPTASWCEATDRANYPIKLSYLYFGMGTSTSGTAYTIDIPGIETIYNVMSAGIRSVKADRSNAIRIYPNPATSNVVTVSLPSTDNAKIMFYNASGSLVKEQYSNGSAQVSVSVDEMPSGLYLVNVIQSGKSSTSKLIVK